MSASNYPRREDIHNNNLKVLGYSDLIDWLQNPVHVYIGRNMTFYVPGAVKHEFSNPYSVAKYGREGCLYMYRDWLVRLLENNTEAYERFRTLRGKTLGCWCKKDEACHGDVIVELLYG